MSLPCGWRRRRWEWQRGGGRRRRRQRHWRRRRGRRWRHWRWRRRLRRQGRRGATRAHEGRPLVRRPTTRGMGRLKQHRAAERDAHRHPAHRHSSDASRPGRRRQQSRCTASGASAKRTRRCASAFIHVDRENRPRKCVCACHPRIGREHRQRCSADAHHSAACRRRMLEDMRARPD